MSALGAVCVPYLVDRMPDDFYGTAWRVPIALESLGHRAVPALVDELGSDIPRHRIVALSFLTWPSDPPEEALELVEPFMPLLLQALQRGCECDKRTIIGNSRRGRVKHSKRSTNPAFSPRRRRGTGDVLSGGRSEWRSGAAAG